MDAGKTCVVVLVEGLPTDPSGACSACAVVSRIPGKHTGVSGCPDVVCYLTLHGATQHANRFQPLFGKRGGIKCHLSGTVKFPNPKADCPIHSDASPAVSWSRLVPKGPRFVARIWESKCHTGRFPQVLAGSPLRR